MGLLPPRGRGFKSVVAFCVFVCLAVCFAAPEFTSAQERAGGTVAVRVTDDQENSVARAEVCLFRFGYGVFSHRAFAGGDGTVEFEDVTPGDYLLQVKADGFETFKERIDVSPRSSLVFSARLEPSPEKETSKAPGRPVSVDTLTVPASARKEFRAGYAELQKNEPSKSEEHFRKAIQEFPSYTEAYAWLGIAYLQDKKNADALTAAQKAVTLDPKLGLTHAVLGKVYLEEKKFSQAEPELLQSIQLDPQAWDTSFELARCYFNMGMLPQALAYAQRANAAPHAPATTHLLLVDIYRRRGNTREALNELEEFTKADPHSPLMPRVQQMISELRPREATPETPKP